MEEKVEAKDKKTIVLIGMMGAGKTTTGFNLAQRLNLKFVDSDFIIEKNEGKDVTAIFDEKGEKYFHDMEKGIITDILNSNKPQILSIGGNSYDDEEIRRLIKQKAVSIFLEVEYNVLLERVKRKNTRPLLENGDKAEILKEIFDKKISVYQEADIVINTTYLNKETSLNVIINSITQYIKNNT
ncbi:MAG: AAA family ATPase [Rickettsiales bacterium]|jgi:shikimate kinase|nr:AAA family ATPase [Rickettsiales bacterium]